MYCLSHNAINFLSFLFIAAIEAPSVVPPAAPTKTLPTTIAAAAPPPPRPPTLPRWTSGRLCPTAAPPPIALPPPSSCGARPSSDRNPPRARPECGWACQAPRDTTPSRGRHSSSKWCRISIRERTTWVSLAKQQPLKYYAHIFCFFFFFPNFFCPLPIFTFFCCFPKTWWCAFRERY